MSRRQPIVKKKPQTVTRQVRVSAGLLGELRAMIDQARAGVARAVDSALTTLYWHIGRRVRADILKQERAAYGQEIVSALGRQLAWMHFKQIIHFDNPSISTARSRLDRQAADKDTDV